MGIVAGTGVGVGDGDAVVSAKRTCILEMLALIELEIFVKEPLTMDTRTSFFITALDDPGGNCK